MLGFRTTSPRLLGWKPTGGTGAGDAFGGELRRFRVCAYDS